MEDIRGQGSKEELAQLAVDAMALDQEAFRKIFFRAEVLSKELCLDSVKRTPKKKDSMTFLNRHKAPLWVKENSELSEFFGRVEYETHWCFVNEGSDLYFHLCFVEFRRGADVLTHGAYLNFPDFVPLELVQKMEKNGVRATTPLFETIFPLDINKATEKVVSIMRPWMPIIQGVFAAAEMADQVSDQGGDHGD